MGDDAIACAFAGWAAKTWTVGADCKTTSGFGSTVGSASSLLTIGAAYIGIEGKSVERTGRDAKMQVSAAVQYGASERPCKSSRTCC